MHHSESAYDAYPGFLGHANYRILKFSEFSSKSEKMKPKIKSTSWTLDRIIRAVLLCFSRNKNTNIMVASKCPQMSLWAGMWVDSIKIPVFGRPWQYIECSKIVGTTFIWLWWIRTTREVAAQMELGEYLHVTAWLVWIQQLFALVPEMILSTVNIVLISTRERVTISELRMKQILTFQTHYRRYSFGSKCQRQSGWITESVFAPASILY